MTKEEKINKIIEVNNFFYNADNHGGRNCWWYPDANYIAYNIKIWCNSITSDDVEKKLTEKQKEYYNNKIEDICQYIYYDKVNMELDFLIDFLKDSFVLVKNVRQAGRSGGWLEVEYINDISNNIDIEELEDMEEKDIDWYYDVAIELEKVEVEVRKTIMEAKGRFELYIESDEWLEELLVGFMSDEEINNTYKYNIIELVNKL